MNSTLSRFLGLIFIAVLLTLSMQVGRTFESDRSIIFRHGLHVVEVELACDECHGEVMELQAGEHAIPDHDICSNCHEVDDESGCGMCHIDPDSPTAVEHASEFYSAYAHDRHSDVECQTCHSEFTAEVVRPTIPDMNDCRECHSQRNGPLSCEMCHGDPVPTPMNHKLASWHLDHGMEASVASSDCDACHSQTSCDDCHQGINLTGSPHPITWKFDHFAAASYGGECMTCHETREFCTDCHRATRPIPPHPMGPAFAHTTEGGAHVEEAKAFIESCISCHDLGGDDATCAKCHD